MQLMSDSMSRLQRSRERHVKQPGACVTRFSYSSIPAPKSPVSDVLDLGPAGFRLNTTAHLEWKEGFTSPFTLAVETEIKMQSIK